MSPRLSFGGRQQQQVVLLAFIGLQMLGEVERLRDSIYMVYGSRLKTFNWRLEFNSMNGGYGLHHMQNHNKCRLRQLSGSSTLISNTTAHVCVYALVITHRHMAMHWIVKSVCVESASQFPSLRDGWFRVPDQGCRDHEDILCIRYACGCRRMERLPFERWG